MLMRDFALQAEFVDAHGEQSLIAAIADKHSLFWELSDLLPSGTFVSEAESWRNLAEAIERDQKPQIPADWKPAPDPAAQAQYLRELFQRRAIAAALESVAEELYNSKTSAGELGRKLEEAARRAQGLVEETQFGQLIPAHDLLPRVLEDAERRQKLCTETGRATRGPRTGIRKLDEILNGLDGLLLLAGRPGIGKTSLVLHISGQVTREASVVYVTFENPPENLVLKAVCAQAGINTQDIDRGTADLEKLLATAVKWGRDVAPRLDFVQGTAHLSLTQLRSHVLQAVRRRKADRCLIVVDYLQLWAKYAAAYRHIQTVRGRVEALGADLRELATQLKFPVLAVSSQNREQGGYGDGRGRTSLDSPKGVGGPGVHV
jgi:replicative DNA helicase